MQNARVMLLSLILGACAPAAAPPVQKTPVTAAAPTPARASSTSAAILPETAPGRLFAGWLEAFNGGDEAKLRAYITAHYSESRLAGVKPEVKAQREHGFRTGSGGMDVVKVEKSTPSELEVVCREKNEMGFWRVKVLVDLQKPELIEKSIYKSIPAADVLPPLPMADLTKHIDAKLTPLAAAGDFSGVVLIAKDGKPLFEKAYGYADREQKLPNTLDTRFRLGSQNKMMTSVAIAQLVQQGKFAYTDTLAKVLPDYPNQEVAKKITVHQLLSHSSGLGDIFGDEFDRTKDSLRTIRDYLTLFVNKPLEFEPGSKFRYSNGGFIVLGLIIEKHSGKDYYEYVRSQIYVPAGMTNAGSTPKTEKDPQIAVGYTRHGPPDAPPVLHPNWETLPWRGMSAGGGQATAHDMLAFANALTSNKLVNAELTKKITTGVIAAFDDENAKYAYGFSDAVERGHRVVGHGGGAPGMNTDLAIYWDAGVTIIVMVNLDPPVAQRVSNYIQGRLQLP
jgi:CubicO group peptidase (beta-lactamase class C family)